MDTSSTEAPIRVERNGPVGWLIFNRSAAGNAMNGAMLDAIPVAWRELDANPDVKVIVVTGEGKAFQTGLDVVQLSREPEALREESRRAKRAELQLTGWHLGVAKPIITAVNGVCAGGGLHFVVDSDIVVAASTATFLDPHVSVGQASAFEPIGLVRRAAFADVARMSLTGAHERITAARAYQLGWVSEIVDPPEQLRARAQELGEQIGSNDAAAMAATKRALWQALEVGLGPATAAARDTAAAPEGTP